MAVACANVGSSQWTQAQPRRMLSRPARRERGGRTARREQRSHGSEGLGRPYIVRNIPTYDILSEENLVRIEQTADRILAEIGIEFRDDPAALEHWKRAGAKVDGALVKFEPGMLREILKTAPAEFTQHARNPANSVVIGGKSVVFSPAYGSPFVMDIDKRPPLRHDRGLPQFREARAVIALAAPFRRHHLRAGRCAGQQAPSRHGLQPHQIFRPRLHGLGHGREPGRRFHRHGAHRVRRRIRRRATASSSATSTSTRRWSGTPR